MLSFIAPQILKRNTTYHYACTSLTDPSSQVLFNQTHPNTIATKCEREHQACGAGTDLEQIEAMPLA